MAARNSRELAELLSRTGRFRNVWRDNGTVFVVQDTDALTGVCTPAMRRRDGQASIQYDINTVVGSARSECFDDVQKRLADGEYLGLPRSTGVAHTFDTFIREGQMSDWLVERILADLGHYTRGTEEALEFIRTGEDRMIENLKRLLPQAFQEIIEQPLMKLVDGRP